jgi:serine/threonine protein kinase/WD40 repeat protein
MPASDSSRDVVLERLAAEFVQRHRNGEHPPLTEYTDRYPDLAGDIRDLFPALVQLEQLKPPADATGDFDLAPSCADGSRLDRLGDYRILREVGRGGMGVVYEAEQESLGRHVALKVLPAAALLSATYLERFRREAKAAGRLHHTNIVPVFGVGEVEGVHFYAMQFIRGEGLDKVLADVRRLRRQSGVATPVTAPTQGSIAHSLLAGHFAPPPAADAPGSASGSSASGDANPSTSGLSMSGPEADYCRGVARIGVQAAEALAYAHRQGVLHRDVKPSNLLLDAQGTVWITDFGLAKAEGSDELTHTGDIVGTIRFMAPERFEGKSLPQSDVYALGITLYELLTLRPAFDDTNKGRLIGKVVHDAPLAPRKIDPRIPRDLETVVLKCLAKDPHERYPSAEALAEDLQRFLADRPVRARRTTVGEQVWRWCRRNPLVASLAGLLLVVLLVTAVGGVVMSVLLNEALDQANTDRDKARDAERQGKKQLFESLVSDAKARRFSGRVGQRFGTLESIRKAAALARELEMPPETFDELRNLAIAALALPDMHLFKAWDWPKGSHGLAIDDQLKLYARGDGKGNITVRRLADDVEIARRTGEIPNILPDGFEDDGRALVLTNPADRSRKRWRLDGKEDVLLGKLPTIGEGYWINSTTDQKLVAALNFKTGVIQVHELATGRRLHNICFGKWVNGPAGANAVMWDMHPWRHELAIAMGDWGEPERQVVRILDLDEGKVQKELIANPRLQVHGRMGWHPDGRTLAVACTYAVVLWDVPTGKEVFRITDHKGGGLHAAVSRSGQLMSTYSEWAGGVKFWHPHTGKPLLNLPNMRIHPTAQAPDGRMYTYRIDDTQLQLWATEPSPVLRVLVRSPFRGRTAEYRRTAVHPGGQLLAVGTTQGVSLFDLARGLDVGHLDLGYNLTVQFDPATGDLLTFGTLGLLRWPVRPATDGAAGLRVGPPQRLLSKAATDQEFRLSRDGRTIAVGDYDRVLVLRADQPGPPLVLKPSGEVRQQISISPDGKWVAAGSHWSGAIDVWDTRTGRLMKRQPLKNTPGLAQFTPDSKRLLVGSLDACRFWNTSDWTESPVLLEKGSSGGWGGGGPMPEFTPDGRLLVWESNEGSLRLLSSATGKEIARLESPDQGRSGYTSFSPDGRFVVTINADYATIQVWDLHTLRQLLKELDLDWNDDPYPAPKAERYTPGTPPLAITIDSGDLAGLARRREAARQMNNDAWHVVTGPVDKRDPALALKKIQQALEDDPDNPMLWNTLGVVQYRNGMYQEARVTLEKSLAAGRDEAAGYDLFFLAMCHAQLGDAAKAKDYFDRAVQWVEAEKSLSGQAVVELKTFRTEAEEVLAKR